VTEKDEVGAVLRPHQIGVEDLLIADDGDGQYRQKQEQQKNGSPFALGHARFWCARIFLDDRRIGWEIFPAGEINRQANQHPNTGGAEAVMPAHLFAERTGDERRGDDSAVDEQIVNLESIGAPVVAGWVQGAYLAGKVALETTDAREQTS